MEKKMTFNYFYGTEADQFSFYRIPKALFTDSYFKDLSSDAKILYGLMLDRMSLSIKNQWFDEKNRAYIYFSIEDIMELLNCGRNKAIKSMQELDDETGIGLIEKRRQGFGKVNIIYVKTFMLEKTEEKSLEEELEKLSKIIYVFLTIFLYLLKCPQSLILSALRAFCFCGKPHISRSIFLYFRYQAWLKSW